MARPFLDALIDQTHALDPAEARLLFAHMARMVYACDTATEVLRACETAIEPGMRGQLLYEAAGAAQHA